MTSNIFPLIGWCVLQVSVIAFAGIVLSILASRRNSLTACAIVCQSAMVCALLTCLAPLPVHQWFAFESRSAPVHEEQRPAVARQSAAIELASDSIREDETSVPMFEFRDLTLAARSLAASMDRFERKTGDSVQILCWILLATVVIGHVRLLAGIAFVLLVKRKGVPITDPNLLRLIHELAMRLDCRTVPCVRESSFVTDAAVAGWIQPTLILPRDWRNWTLDERRSVIAHELVHIVRRDSLWRAAASVLLATHFFNPVVHWLLRRVVLYQELSADVMAANVVGRPLYLRSLSSLAIRRDDRLIRESSSGLLPVFSGFLIRRIKKLHSTEGRTDMNSQNKQKSITAVVAVLLLVTGIATIVARGIAVPPKEHQTQTTHENETVLSGPVSFVMDRGYETSAESATVSFTGNVTGFTFSNGNGASFTGSSAGNPPKVEDAFSHLPLDPSILGANNQIGLAVVRVRDLFQRPELKIYAPLLNAYITSALVSELKLKSAPAIDVNIVEWIATRPAIHFKAATKENKSMFMVGAGGCLIKLTKLVDLKQWFDQFIPDAPRHVIEGQEVFQLNATALGPAPLFVWTTDRTTIRFGLKQPETITPETTLADFDGDPVFGQGVSFEKAGSQTDGPENRLKWDTTWNRIDRGLLSVLIAKADLSGLFSDFDNRPDFQGEFAAQTAGLIKSIKSRCLATALGFDIGGGSLAGIQCSFVHPSGESAEQSAKDIGELLKAAKLELEKQRELIRHSASKRDDEQQMICVCIEALDTLTKVTVDEYQDGTAAAIISGGLPFHTLVQLAIMVSKDEDDSAEGKK